MQRVLKHSRLNNLGFSLIEILIASAILVTVASAGAALFQSVFQAKKKSETISTVLKFRSGIIDSMISTDSLAKTSEDPDNATTPYIGCLKTLQNCFNASTPWQNISVTDNAGNYLTRSTTANFGFGVDQRTCTSYPSEACPFRYTVEWRSLCDATVPLTCVTPQFKVRGTLLVWDKFKIPISTDLHNFEVTLGQHIGTYEQACTSMGGTYVLSDPPKCAMPAIGDCDPMPDGTLQMVVGYTRGAPAPGPTPGKLCKAVFKNVLNGASCPAGTVMQKVDAAGNPACFAIAPAPAPGLTQIPYCDKFPLDVLCKDVIPAAANFSSSSGDGGCDGGDGGC